MGRQKFGTQSRRAAEEGKKEDRTQRRKESRAGCLPGWVAFERALNRRAKRARPISTAKALLPRTSSSLFASLREILSAALRLCVRIVFEGNTTCTSSSSALALTGRGGRDGFFWRSRDRADAGQRRRTGNSPSLPPRSRSRPHKGSPVASKVEGKQQGEIPPPP